MQPIAPTYPTGNYSLGHGFFLLYGYGGYGANSTFCNAAVEFPNKYILRNPFLSFFSLIALTIGIYCGKTIRASGYKNFRPYSVTFFTYGCMMSFAALADSIFPHPTHYGGIVYDLDFFIVVMDVTLTSSIAASFMFNGLADVGLMNPDSKLSLFVQFLTYFSILCGYTWGLIYSTNGAIFMYLYVYLILFTCGLYVVCELVYLFWMGHSQGIGFLFLAGVAGGLGLYMTMNYPVWLCQITTPLFGNQEIWFLLSDVAMFLIFLFYMKNHSPESEEKAKEHHNKGEENAVELEAVAPLLENPDRPLAPVYVSAKKH